MNFLVPLYLLGAVAVAVPIYLHLRRKPPKDSVEFGSLMFLRPTAHPPVKRSRKLENLPLLLLRCLALLLLAGFFARPFLRGGEEELEQGSARTVLLLDTSASMRRDGVWEAAKTEAAEVIDAAGSGDALAIVTADGSPRTVVGFDDWLGSPSGRRQSLAGEALASLEPSWQGSDLGSGLLAAAELLAEAAAGEDAASGGRIVVISDLQAGANLDAVGGASWPGGVEVELRPIEARATTNATLAVAPGPDPDRPLVRVINDAASERESFTLEVGDQRFPAVVPAGESRVVELPAETSEVLLSGDAEDFDNRLFLAPREPAPVTLAFLGEGEPDDADRPEYYFRRAFGRSELLEPRFAEDLAENPTIIAVARPLDLAELEAVRGRLEAGARVLLLISSTEMAETLGRLAGAEETPELEEVDGRYALLEGIDFEHPTLRGFRDPRWRDFTDVHFWRHRRLDPEALPGARVIAGFDNGDPAWLEIPVGRGGLIVMTSGWHPRDSQLALSSKFVPLLYSIFAEQGPRVGEARQFFVGEMLPVEGGDRRLVLPGGEVWDLGEGEVFRPEEPGIYRVEGEGPARRFAVNLRPSESDLGPLGKPALVALGVPLAGGAAAEVPTGEAGKRRLRDREAEANQDLWRWAAVGLLALLIIESAVASRSGSAEPQPEGATS